MPIRTPGAGTGAGMPYVIITNNTDEIPEEIHMEIIRCAICNQAKHCHYIWFDSIGDPHIHKEPEEGIDVLMCTDCMIKESKRLKEVK